MAHTRRALLAGATALLTTAITRRQTQALGSGQPAAADPGRIRPWPANSSYWQYRGAPVLLLGGSKDDNLFQIPDLQAHLDEMKAAGANYIRNTMSDRRDGGFEVYPFAQTADGTYDLTQWNGEYWARFDRLLALTRERDIIVQIELWDRFDYSRNNWGPHPYNPANTRTYTAESTGLARDYPNHPGTNEQPFFFSTPAQRNIKPLLAVQQRFAEQVLTRTLPQPHVLYCIDNETSGDELWSTYWADFIRERASRAGVEAYVTEMWDDHDLKGSQHRRTFDHPERYTFVDVSQNNHQKGQAHWDNFQWVRQHLSARLRPINTVKTYGSDEGPYGTDLDGLQRWWRHLIGGAAAMRFHRPKSGLGFSPKAAAAIRAARKLESVVKPWALTPANERLRERAADAAYLAMAADGGCALFFPAPGKVVVDLTSVTRPLNVRWISIDTGDWGPATTWAGGAPLLVETPGPGLWVAAGVGGR
ncbi:hypothetical protein LuPra_06146 [Luteitalea pratensis]|uniref:Collagen-binding domain of a collagenase n=1 Tax=Luteitalea pratensis TaxID=1855912 RepID=A0A143PWA8_LUTPR|nr:hypothetical protein [Luteitalea pratensis]AMY12862.1 hypothetical protein LuPra_06146 [Luteitalea pratensis]